MRTRLLVIVGTGITAAALAAGSASAHRAATPDVAGTTATVTASSGLVAFTAPGPALKASAAKGKAVVVIPSGSRAGDLSSLTAYLRGIREAGAAAGLVVSVCANHGLLIEQSICINQAIDGKASAIVLVGSLDLAGLKVPLAAAKKAAVPVIGAHVLTPGEITVPAAAPVSGDVHTQPAASSEAVAAARYQEALTGLAAVVRAPYVRAAQLLADIVTSKANGVAKNIVVLGSSDLPQNATMLSAIKAEFASACGAACSVTTVDVPSSRWQQDTFSTVQVAVLKKKTDYLVPLYDGIAGLVSQGLNDARRTVPTLVRPDVVTYGGSPFAIQMGQAAARVVGDVAENMGWNGWATIDQTLRVLTGAPLAVDSIPLRIFSSANWYADGMSFPPVIDGGWGDPASTYVAGYRKLWGLPGA